MDFPDWPFAHHNLAMVGGADKLCSYLADGRQTIRVEVIASKALLPLSRLWPLDQDLQQPLLWSRLRRNWFLKLPKERMDKPRHAVCAGAVPKVYLCESLSYFIILEILSATVDQEYSRM